MWMPIAEELLATLETAFDAFYPLTPDGKKQHPRRYVSDGGVLFDWTPLLAVEWDGTEPAFSGEGGEGPSGGSPASIGGGFAHLRVMFSIHVTRDSPWPDEVGTPPQPAKIKASADRVASDAKLVLDTLLARLGDDTLLGACARVDILRQTPVGPDGGVVGSVTSIAVYL
jgi:hypothetical protein